MANNAIFACSICTNTYPASQPRWRCDCGGPLRLRHDGMFSVGDLARRPATLWRYREALGAGGEVVTLGEGMTPLVRGQIGERETLLKLDSLNPTGSFKDRGSTVLASQLAHWGIAEIVEDSSGNAGASMAAYAAAAGIRAHVYVPASTSPGKAAQIAMYGANLVRVPGSREQTAEAARLAGEQTFYSSHNWAPHFVSGLKTIAYEIAEQLGWHAPDWILTPLGGGSLFLGLAWGFEDLRQAGIIPSVPRLVGVQSVNCAPVHQAWMAGLDHVPAVEKGPTVAEGISMAQPVRGKDILEVLRAGSVIATVSDEAIWNAVDSLGRQGVYVEPTAAAGVAALPDLCFQGLIQPKDRVVAVLTGSGLKATDKMAGHLGL